MLRLVEFSKNGDGVPVAPLRIQPSTFVGEIQQLFLATWFGRWALMIV
jgi:hypothetical protein